MPMLLRLGTVAAAVVGLGYGAMLALVLSLPPQRREVLVAADRPGGVELRTGRSIAAALNRQAGAFARQP